MTIRRQRILPVSSLKHGTWRALALAVALIAMAQWPHDAAGAVCGGGWVVVGCKPIAAKPARALRQKTHAGLGKGLSILRRFDGGKMKPVRVP